MATRKTEERFELMEKEIKKVRSSVEKGIGEMEKGIGEVRAEISQNRVEFTKNLTEIRRMMEEQMKFFRAPSTAPEKTVAPMVAIVEDCEANRADDHELYRAGATESRRAGTSGCRARWEEGPEDPRVPQNMIFLARDTGLREKGEDRTADLGFRRNLGREERERERGLA
ncbi:hypothetical protein L484_027987 [Morus notabilis]|uniref:Uncharacterized protein n=1 Tax=Morus notabilis TaxID=981085 RepID=W9SFU2_9ROSA|nr:hypothetical protein L484_027987 [Morus notabilis]